MSLDFDRNSFQKYLHHAVDVVSDLYENKLDRRVFAGKSPDEVLSAFDENLPEAETSVDTLLEKVRMDVIGSATMNIGPRYFGYITGGGNQVAIMGDLISSALNQNNLKWHSSPISTEIEKLVIRWVSQFIGYLDQAAGAILDGGSTANFNCLAVARKNMGDESVAEDGMYGQKPMTIYVSEEGHSSFDKAVDMLGIGKKYLRKIPVDDQFQVDVKKLEEKILQDKSAGLNPICVIGIAGTTNTGAIDDLKTLADVAKKHGLWYHVDAAYGGPAAAVESVRSQFSGLEKADSVVINPHKWLYVPFEAACILVKEPEKLRRTFSHLPDYLKSDSKDDGRTDMMEYQLPLTKSFKSLKVWMTLKAYGAKRLRETIQEDIDKAAYLVDMIENSDDMELLAPAPLSIVCFRYAPKNLDEKEIEKVNQQLIAEIEADGRIFLTGTRLHGKTALRVCIINPRTTREDVEFILEVARDIGGKL